MTGPYECTRCEGIGESECDHCGSEIPCPACKGTGLDLELIDIEAWNKAARKFGEPCNFFWWHWIVDDRCMGLQKEGGATLAHADFARNKSTSTTEQAK